MLTPAEIRKHHVQRLRDNKHLRYMWIPGTDAVVVVTCNELAEVSGRAGWVAGWGPGAGPVLLCFAVGVFVRWEVSERACTAASLVACPSPLPPLPLQGEEPAAQPSKWSEDQRLAPLRALLRSRSTLPAEEVEGLSATQCRDALLALGPLEADWVKKVNVAEAEYWRRW